MNRGNCLNYQMPNTTTATSIQAFGRMATICQNPSSAAAALEAGVTVLSPGKQLDSPSPEVPSGAEFRHGADSESTFLGAFFRPNPRTGR